ncbi:hypothetical protein GCM10025873_02130 [Demequina sediminis]|uniref:alpha/beta fold hydrolase n=1 Tax=Demequina sediminis TaxID=1930058 RepID=UPI0025740139|nr:hypothetical protein [Demequina sediminis]BDZ60422.1 hypothetical protein GCM10025873_02130 [Demequina sediminis]
MRDDARYRAAEAAVWERHELPSPTEHWVDHPRGRIRVLARGEGRPVLFIHGSPTAGASLVPLAGALASGPLSGLRVLVVDRPGCGLSDPLDPPPATSGSSSTPPPRPSPRSSRPTPPAPRMSSAAPPGERRP